ncbi:unnamed protein product [Urochloa humidicola]
MSNVETAAARQQRGMPVLVAARRIPECVPACRRRLGVAVWASRRGGALDPGSVVRRFQAQWGRCRTAAARHLRVFVRVLAYACVGEG